MSRTTIIAHNQQQNILNQNSFTFHQFKIALTIHKLLKFNNNPTLRKLTKYYTTLHQISTDNLGTHG